MPIGIDYSATSTDTRTPSLAPAARATSMLRTCVASANTPTPTSAVAIGSPIAITTARGRQFLPFLTFNGLSKNYRSCGYRAGWVMISGPKEIATDFLEGLTLLAGKPKVGKSTMMFGLFRALEDGSAAIEPGFREVMALLLT